jgi:hypothetical protein
MCWLVRSSARADHSIGSALLQPQTGFGGKDQIGNWRSNCRRPGRTTEFARHAGLGFDWSGSLGLPGVFPPPRRAGFSSVSPWGGFITIVENGQSPVRQLKDFPRGFTSRLRTKEFAVNLPRILKINNQSIIAQS